jgi:hypothetical protein
MDENQILCSKCFVDQGLKLLAQKIGFESRDVCPNCKKMSGEKLSSVQVQDLAYRFFVVGSIFKPKFGAAPQIQINNHQKTNIKFSKSLEKDVKLLEEILGIGFFHYGPRLWMLGEIGHLKNLQHNKKRIIVFDRILKEYPSIFLNSSELFYRIRLNPEYPNDHLQYDSPPMPGSGRLDSDNHPVLYGSQDLEVCIHECRVTVEDEIYVATLQPKKKLKLLDLTELIQEECSEFESLDLSIQMLFLAGKHSYEIAKELSLRIRDAGFDGIIYPSYFSLVRTGRIPFPTVYGISTRKFPGYRNVEKTSTIPNIALFGRPIKEIKVEVININKMGINRIIYDYEFGPSEIN